jgi:hypothetical protein
MKAARILILGVAFAMGGAAAFLIGPGEEKPQFLRAIQTADLLVAQGSIGPLSLALRLFDASKVAEGTIGRALSARSHWWQQQTNDAS